MAYTGETDVATKQRRSIPDVADAHRRLIAFAVLAIGAKYAVSASSFLIDPGLASSLELLKTALALLAVGLILPVFIWKARNLSRDGWYLYKDDQGFVARTIVQAQTGSWTLTFLVLVLAEALDRTLAGLSWVLLSDVVLAVMLLSFSIIFLYLDWTSGQGVAGGEDA